MAQTTNQPKRRVPLGRPLERTDADLDRLSEITPEDIEQAQTLVTSANPTLAKLMDARLVDDADQNELADA